MQDYASSGLAGILKMHGSSILLFEDAIPKLLLQKHSATKIKTMDYHGYLEK